MPLLILLLLALAAPVRGNSLRGGVLRPVRAFAANQASSAEDLLMGPVCDDEICEVANMSPMSEDEPGGAKTALSQLRLWGANRLIATTDAAEDLLTRVVLSEVEADVELYRSALQENAATLGSIGDELDVLRQELHAAEAALQTERDAFDAREAALVSELAESRAATSAAQTEVAALKSSMASLEVALRSKSAELEDFQTRLVDKEAVAAPSGLVVPAAASAEVARAQVAVVQKPAPAAAPPPRESSEGLQDEFANWLLAGPQRGPRQKAGTRGE